MKKIKAVVWFVVAVMMLSFLPAYALPSTIIASEKDTDCDISVMSYNVLHDGSGDWQYQTRLPLVLQTVRRYDADLIGFQEVTKQWVTYLKNNMPDYTFYTVNDKNTVGEAIMMAYRTERFELLDQGYFYLSETPEVRSKGWDATDYRLLIWNKLYDKQTGQTILQGNTHLYHSLETARFYGAQMVNEFLQEQDIPFFCCGDYNSERTSSFYQNMIAGKVGDSYYMTDNGDNSYTYPSKSLYLDYILVNEESVKVVKHDVIDDTYYGMTTSDHSAVICYYDFAEEKLGFSFASGSYDSAAKKLTDVTTEGTYTFSLQSEYGNTLEVYSDSEMTQRVDPEVTLALGDNTYYIKVATVGGTLEETLTAVITYAKSSDCTLYEVAGAEPVDDTTFRYRGDLSEYLFSASAAPGATVELFHDEDCTVPAQPLITVSDSEETYYIKVTAQAGNHQVYRLLVSYYPTKLLVQNVVGDIEAYIVNEAEKTLDIGYLTAPSAFPEISFGVAAESKWYADEACSAEVQTPDGITENATYYLKTTAEEREKIYTVTLRFVSAVPENTLFVNPAVQDKAAGESALCYGGKDTYLAVVGEKVFATVVEAVAAAKTGDTVFVAAGKYDEYVVIDKPITLYGANYDVSPITRGEKWSYNTERREESYMYGTIEAVEAISDWTVSGFYFAGDREDGANIEMNTDTVPLYNILFEKNVFSSKITHEARSPIRGYGSSPKIITIRDNYYMTTGNTRAFTMRNLEDLRIENNYICDAQTLSFLSAQVKLNVSAPGKNNVAFIGNRVENCRGALNLYATFATNGVNWVFENNEFYNNSGVVLYLELGNNKNYPTDYANCNIRLVGNKFKNNGTDIKFAGGSKDANIEVFGNYFYKTGTNFSFSSNTLPYMDLRDNYFEKTPTVSGGFSDYSLSPYWIDEAFTQKGGAEEREAYRNEYFVSSAYADTPAGTKVKFSSKQTKTQPTVGLNAFGTVAAAIEQIVADAAEDPVLYLSNGTYKESVTVPVSLTVRGYYAGVDPVDKSGESIIDRWNISADRPRGNETTLQGVWTVEGDDMTQFTLDGVRLSGAGRVLITDGTGDTCHVTIQNITLDSTTTSGKNGVFSIGQFACAMRYYVTIRNMYVRTNLSTLFDKIVAQQVTLDNVFYGDNRAQFFYGCLPKVAEEHLQEPVFFHVTNSMFWNTDEVLLNFSWTDYNANSGGDVNATERERMEVVIDNNVFVDTMRDAASSWVVRPQIDSDNIFYTVTNNTVWQREHSDGAFIYTHSHKIFPSVSDQFVIRHNRFIGANAQNAVIGIKNGTIDLNGNYFADDEAKVTTPEKYAGAYTAYTWYYLNEDFTLRSDCSHSAGDSDRKAPSCKEDGYEKLLCALCGDTMQITVLPKNGDHIEDIEHMLVLQEPTCKETGIGRTACKVCGVTMRSGIIIPTLDEHVEDTERILVDTMPDCKTPGKGYTACGICGERMRENIPIPKTDDHVEDIENIVVDTKPTCGTTGLGHTVCKVCGITITPKMYIDPVGAHTAGEWKIQRYATFTAFGEEVQHCTVCKKEISRRYSRQLAPFPDVKSGAWYYDEVEYTVGRSIFAGVAENGTLYFKPNDNTTRGQVVMVLANIAGIDTEAYKDMTVFTDVPADKWYSGAVNWAAKTGVAAGITQTTFKPNDKVTREQFAAFMVRFAAKQLGKTMPIKENMIAFTDAAKISAWAKADVTACVKADIINGVENTDKKGTFRFDPQGNATRAQLAVMVRQFMENVMK